MASSGLDSAGITAFYEIRSLLRYGPWTVPGRTARLAYLFDQLAMSEDP